MKKSCPVCNWPPSKKPRLVLSEAVKANWSICDCPPSCLYDTSKSFMFLWVKFEPVVRALPFKSSRPYSGGWWRTKVRALSGVSGSVMARESWPMIMVEPHGTVRPLFRDKDGRTRSTVSTAISKVPFLLVLPLLTTNLPNHTRNCKTVFAMSL